MIAARILGAICCVFIAACLVAVVVAAHAAT